MKLQTFFPLLVLLILSLVFACLSTNVFALTFFSSKHGFDSVKDKTEKKNGHLVAAPLDVGIKESISNKYKERFQKWKGEFLATEIGRQQWMAYANNRNFLLTIKVTDDRGKGAGTDKFVWDLEGRLVGATITLGAEIDRGYPAPVYYPVLNSLSAGVSQFEISGNVLAATKISHEIGHVNQTAEANRHMLEIQTKLVPVYISIFLKNGLNTTDARLTDIASQMGGTPIEIWESREYWSEVNAMLYLRERIGQEPAFCSVFGRIKKNLNTYAREYKGRFNQFPDISDSPCWKLAN